MEKVTLCLPPGTHSHGKKTKASENKLHQDERELSLTQVELDRLKFDMSIVQSKIDTVTFTKDQQTIQSTRYKALCDKEDADVSGLALDHPARVAEENDQYHAEYRWLLDQLHQNQEELGRLSARLQTLSQHSREVAARIATLQSEISDLKDRS